MGGVLLAVLCEAGPRAEQYARRLIVAHGRAAVERATLASPEKRLLQAVVAVLAITPVVTGGAGIVLGPDFLGLDPPWPADLDSHFRFLSGTFLVVGLLWWSCVPGIERKTARFRLLAALTFAGGLARLLSLIVAGAPSAGHLAGLFVELVLVPPLVLWQGRIARHS